MTSDQLFAVVSITLGASVIVWYFYEQIRAFKKLFDDLRICFCCFDLGNGDYEIRAYNHYGDIYVYRYQHSTNKCTDLNSIKSPNITVVKQIRAYLYECLNNNLVEKKEIQ